MTKNGGHGLAALHKESFKITLLMAQVLQCVLHEKHGFP
jgi:hypothetical protein